MKRLLLPLALALVAGCGGDGSSDEPTKERFVADANRICREGEAKIAEVAQSQRSKPVPDILETTVEAYEPYMARLRDVRAPDRLAEAWSTFLDGVQEAFDLIPELAAATRDDDEEKLAELTTRFSDIADDTRPFAQNNGLAECLPENG